jgi:hypothetical protein
MPIAFRIPFEILEPIERLIITAKDLYGMTNEEIAALIVEPPEVVARRLNIPVTEVPTIPTTWSRANLANNVAVAYKRAWMKLTLTLFGEEVLTEPRYKAVWARWIDGHGPTRVAQEVGPDPDCASRSRCRRSPWGRHFDEVRLDCWQHSKQSILKCLQMTRANTCSCWREASFRDLKCPSSKDTEAALNCLEEMAVTRITEIELAAARAIGRYMDDAI